MSFKYIAVCVSVALVQQISAQCNGNAFNNANLGFGIGNSGLAGNIGAGNLGYAGNNFGSGCGLGNGLSVPNTNGGGLVVTSSSPLSPTGVSVLAENLAIEGPLNVGGQLPLLGAVALEGQLPSNGQGGVSYSCGNGNVGISDASAGAGLIGNGIAGPGFNGNGFAGAGIGNGVGFGRNLNAGGCGGNY